MGRRPPASSRRLAYRNRSRPLPGPQSRPAARHDRARGFTLIELLVVISLASVVSLLVFPRFHGLMEASLTRARARGAVLAMKSAQQRAAGLNRPVVAFFPEPGRIAFYADLDLDGTADLPAEGTAARFPGSVPWSGYASFELGQGRTLSASGFPLGAHQRAEVTLRADGTASAGGVVRITDHRGTVYDLEVRPTGAVHLSRSYGV